jgi:shikimate kinase
MRQHRVTRVIPHHVPHRFRTRVIRHLVNHPANRELLRERTTVCYLRVTPEEIFRRLRHDRQRPLLQVDDPEAKLRELFAQRDPLYQETAHYVIESHRPRIPTMVTMVMSQLELAGLLPVAETPPHAT